MFENREDAGSQLAKRFEGRQFRDPLVLAIPRGGVIVGAALADVLDAEMDIILSRKLRAPGFPHIHIGAVCEDKRFVIADHAEIPGLNEQHLAEETQRESREIERLKSCFRQGRPPAPIRGRSVIVTDDGMTTGASMTAALQAVRIKEPFEVIVAVPLAAQDQIDKIRLWCDEVVCVMVPAIVGAIRQFYKVFPEITDAMVVELLQKKHSAPEPGTKIRRHGPVRPPIGVLTEKEWQE